MARSFNGTSDRISLTPLTSFNVTTLGFSVCAHLNQSASASTAQPVLSRGQVGGSGDGWTLQRLGANDHLGFTKNGVVDIDSTLQMPVSDWGFVGAVVTPTQVRFTRGRRGLDLVQAVANNSQAITALTNLEFYIGGAHSTGGADQYFTGAIEYVAVWMHRMLGDGEMAAMAVGASPRRFNPEFYWRLGEHPFVRNLGYGAPVYAATTLTSPSLASPTVPADPFPHIAKPLRLLAAGAPSSAIKTVEGLARASVKTVSGLALASVKTVEGLA